MEMTESNSIETLKAETFKKAKRIVVKIGTNVITKDDGYLHLSRLKSLVSQIIYLKNKGYEILIVTSGAIGAGIAKLGFKEKPTDLVLKQASAAVGQSALMHYYEKYFKKYNQHVAQVLLTQDELLDDTKRTNLYNTLAALLKLNVVPIINENDVVSTYEILPAEDKENNENEWLNFSDNDTLSAAIAGQLGADLLILLSDVDGLYDRYPIDAHSKLIEYVDNKQNSTDLEILANGKNKDGRGGMKLKIKAAKTAAEKGIATIIANGRKKDVLIFLINGKQKCTFFSTSK